MTNLKIFLPLLVTLLILGQCTSTGTLDIISKIHHIAERVKMTADSIQSLDEGDTKTPRNDVNVGHLMKSFKEICNQIDETEAQYSQYNNITFKSVDNLVKNMSSMFNMKFSTIQSVTSSHLTMY